MTKDQFDAALRLYGKRRPFKPFLLEFMSGNQILIGHPEAIRNEGIIYTMRRPDGGPMVFAAESVARLFDVPTAGTT